MITILAKPNPFNEADTVVCEAQPGTNLLTLLPNATSNTNVVVNTLPISRGDWGNIILHDGDFVVITNVPKGEFLKDVFSFAATSALVVGTTISLVQSVTQMIKGQPKVGVPAQPIDNRYGPITSQSNQPNRYGVIPKLYGQYRINPPLAANYYFYSFGDEQYMAVLLCLGYGPLYIGKDENVPGGAKGRPVGRMMDKDDPAYYYPMLHNQEDGTVLYTYTPYRSEEDKSIYPDSTSVAVKKTIEINLPSVTSFGYDGEHYQQWDYDKDAIYDNEYTQSHKERVLHYQYWYDARYNNNGLPLADPVLGVIELTQPASSAKITFESDALIAWGDPVARSDDYRYQVKIRLNVVYRVKGEDDSSWVPYNFKTAGAKPKPMDNVEWFVPDTKTIKNTDPDTGKDMYDYTYTYNLQLQGKSPNKLTYAVEINFPTTDVYEIGVVRHATHAKMSLAIEADLKWSVTGGVVASGIPKPSNPDEIKLPPNTIRFGNTGIENFKNCLWEIGHPNQITLYSEDIETYDVSAIFNLQVPTSVPEHSVGIFDDKTNRWYHATYNNSGPPIQSGVNNYIATTNINKLTEYAVIELAFTSLFCSGLDGSTNNAGVRLLIEYSISGENTWITYINPTPATQDNTYGLLDEALTESDTWDYKKTSTGASSSTTTPAKASVEYKYNFEITKNSRLPKRFGVKIVFPTPGVYDVRVTRQATYITKFASINSDFVWTELRSVINRKPWAVKEGHYSNDVVLMALRLKNSGQLTGNIDTVTVMAQAILRAVDSVGNWEYKPTSNPAWAYLDAISGPQVYFPLRQETEVDTDAIYQWARWCDNSSYFDAAGAVNGYKTEYNWYHTAEETLLDRIKAITATGFASWAVQDNKFSVVSEFAKEDAFTPRQLFTARNSSGFSFDRRFINKPHALRVKYIDPDVYQEAEQIVYAWKNLDQSEAYTEATASKYEVIETQGVLSFEQAIREGNYYLNTMLTRQETYTLETDIENLAVTRGDCVKVAYDTLHSSVYSGRVSSITVNSSGLCSGISLDSPVIVQYKHPDDMSVTAISAYGVYVRNVNSTEASTTLHAVDNPLFPGETGRIFTLSFKTPVSTNQVSVGCLVSFGLIQSQNVLTKIVKIDYKEDLSARLTMVSASDRSTLEKLGSGYTKSNTIAPPPTEQKPARPTSPTLTYNPDGIMLDTSGYMIPAVTVMWNIGSKTSTVTPSVTDKVTSYIINYGFISEEIFESTADVNRANIPYTQEFSPVSTNNKQAILSIPYRPLIDDSGKTVHQILKATVYAVSDNGMASVESEPGYFKFSDLSSILPPSNLLSNTKAIWGSITNRIVDDEGTVYTRRYAKKVLKWNKMSASIGNVNLRIPEDMSRVSLRLSADLDIIDSGTIRTSAASHRVRNYAVNVKVSDTLVSSSTKVQVTSGSTKKVRALWTGDGVYSRDNSVYIYTGAKVKESSVFNFSVSLDPTTVSRGVTVVLTAYIDIPNGVSLQ